jgi:hypothetical protein
VASAEIVAQPTARRDKCYGCDECCCCECRGYEDEDELSAEDRIMNIMSDIEDGSISPKYGAMLISDIISGEWGV